MLIIRFSMVFSFSGTLRAATRFRLSPLRHNTSPLRTGAIADRGSQFRNDFDDTHQMVGRERVADQGIGW